MKAATTTPTKVRIHHHALVSDLGELILPNLSFLMQWMQLAWVVGRGWKVGRNASWLESIDGEVGPDLALLERWSAFIAQGQ